MLVTRHRDTENPWSISKFETSFHKPATSSRMSTNFDAPLSTQSDWQGQYSFLPPGENTIFSQSYEPASSSNDNGNPSARPRTAEIGIKAEHSSPIGHHRSLDPLGLRQTKQPSPIPEQVEPQSEDYAQKTADTVKEESLVPTDPPGLSLGSNPLCSVSSAGQGHEISSREAATEEHVAGKDEDDDVIDDEEMMEGDGESSTRPQTAAERTAQRRKMKRFRLTHQQTRFLMSEFAKQPHPDAAHRERLSREIPGLSPRQVQVWFQNRRAKIKRLTADDRDRMIKMRAVPDDFDNVQALHSPYGAVHGIGTPISSPVDFGTSSYAEHMMRPLMVDVRRPEGEEHISPTGLSPAFGNIGFNPSATMSNADVLSPMSPTSNDQYRYSSHLSSPLSASSRSSNPFGRQNSLDTSMQMQNHPQRQHVRPLQPLQLRETLNRSRSEQLQSPLRTSMSWKGDAIDYTSFHPGHNSPPFSGRQQSVYQHDQMSGNTNSGLGGYEGSSYSGSAVQSPTQMSYSSLQSPSLQQQQQQNRSRLRAASGPLPLGLDLRTQFRSVGSGSQQSMHSPGPRTPTTQYGSASSSYTASFSSAPLAAPNDFSLPRSSSYRPGHDYPMPQMSAPIAPSNDFSHAFQNMAGSNARTPMRETFGGGPFGGGHGQGSSSSSGDRHDDYGHDALGKRRRSFTVSQGAPAATHQAYGHTT